jgi:hypothetical protein
VKWCSRNVGRLFGCVDSRGYGTLATEEDVIPLSNKRNIENTASIEEEGDEIEVSLLGPSTPPTTSTTQVKDLSAPYWVFTWFYLMSYHLHSWQRQLLKAL